MRFFVDGKYKSIGIQAMLWVCCTSLCLAQTPDHGKQSAALEQEITLRQNDAGLKDALRLLQAIGINALADGEPALQKANFDVKGTAREALDQIADTFDYKWRMTRDGIVLMTKRFKGAQERPQMHITEMSQMAKDIYRALSLAPTNDFTSSPNPTLRQLLLSLSPEQYKAITGARPFYGRDLQADQLQLFTQGIWQFDMPQAYQSWELLTRVLPGFPTSYLNVDPINTRATIVVEDGKERKKVFTDVSHIVRDTNGQLQSNRLGEPFISNTEDGKP